MYKNSIKIHSNSFIQGIKEQSVVIENLIYTCTMIDKKCLPLFINCEAFI